LFYCHLFYSSKGGLALATGPHWKSKSVLSLQKGS